MKILHYSVERYPFAALAVQTLGEPLEQIDLGLPLVTRATDQDTIYHRAFYSRALPMYATFIREYITPVIGEPFYYQRVPTFRLQLRGNLAVGETHRDADYGHPDGEINFWLPLTRAMNTNTIHIEGQPIDAVPGDIIMFDAVNTLHGNVVSRESWTRVSFDFRCLPIRRFNPKHPGRSVNTHTRFVPGEYYAS